jgi:hypothetical protein
MAKELKTIESLQQLLFEGPLYAIYKLPEGKWWKGDNLEGHCPECKKESIFKVVWKAGGLQDHIRPYKQRFTAEAICRCTRHEHVLQFQLMLHEETVQKWGQFPSFADVTEGSLKPYRGALGAEDATELNRATGLAAHGVGIGSFVYIRRIFERLINKRFDEFKDEEGWDAEKFKTMRMDDRIDLMKNHLPDFMVKGRKFYGILSTGLHQLKEDECLAFFDIARRSIVFILDEDHRKREQLSERKAAMQAIADYKPPA